MNYKSFLINTLTSDDCDRFLLDDKGGWVKNNLPELYALKHRINAGHKDNYIHTAGVLGNVIAAEQNYFGTTSQKMVMRLVAIFHDLGKGPTMKLEGNKYTFWNHEAVSAGMLNKICTRLELGLTESEMEMLHTVVKLHGRPKSIVEEGVTDSAVRRLMKDAGDHFFDLIWFCKCDATTKFQHKKDRYNKEMDDLLARAARVAAQDEAEAWRPPFNGHDIMEILGLESSDRNSGGIVGEIKDNMVALIKASELAEDREVCLDYIRGLAVTPAFINLRRKKAGLPEIPSCTCKAGEVYNNLCCPVHGNPMTFSSSEPEEVAIEFSLEDVVAAAQYGFEWHRDSQNDGVAIPSGNVLQWLMARKGLTLVPKAFKNFKA